VRLRTFFLRALPLLAAACAGPAPSAHHDFGIDVRVSGDDGRALAGAVIHRGTETLGKTDADGRLLLAVSGPEGQTVALRLTCPGGYTEPKGTPSVRLARTRRVGASAPEPQKLTLVCSKLTRNAVVVVRAPGGAELPITINGEPAGTTDADGNAHVLVEVHRGLRALDVTLDTGKEKLLTPRNPRKLFELEGEDAVLLFEQPLAVRYRARPSTTAAPTPKKHVPTRID
jgi:hypothetical protein